MTGFRLFNVLHKVQRSLIENNFNCSVDNYESKQQDATI